MSQVIRKPGIPDGIQERAISGETCRRARLPTPKNIFVDLRDPGTARETLGSRNERPALLRSPNSPRSTATSGRHKWTSGKYSFPSSSVLAGGVLRHTGPKTMFCRKLSLAGTVFHQPEGRPALWGTSARSVMSVPGPWLRPPVCPALAREQITQTKSTLPGTGACCGVSVKSGWGPPG